jgi:membrane protease YdiL (CAAX protease family)
VLLLEIQDNLLAFALTAAVAGIAVAPLYFMYRPRRLLPLERTRTGSWSGLEIWLAFLLFLLIPPITIDFLDSLGFFQKIYDKPPSSERMALWVMPLATPLILAFLVRLFFLVSRTRPSHLGLTPARWPHNTLVGYFSFLVLTPVVIGLYVLILVLMQLLQSAAPQPHPFGKLSQEGLMPVEWALFFLQAIVCAPVLEEVMFRGVLQGWLRRAPFLGHVMITAATVLWGLSAFLASLVVDRDGARGPNLGPLVFAVVMAAGYGWGVYRVWAPMIWEGRRYFVPKEAASDAAKVEEMKQTGSPEGLLPTPAPITPEQQALAEQHRRDWQNKNAVLAILGSAMLFAVVHSNVWPSPIPLFVLAVGLGYLAYRTQSLLAGVVVHALFNTVAAMALAVPLVREWLKS